MKNTSTIRNDHEYLLIAYKNNKILNKSFEKPKWGNFYGNPDKDPRGNYKVGIISRKEEDSNPNHKFYYSVTSPSGKTFTKQFEISKEDFDKLNIHNKIYWRLNDDSVPSIKISESEKREVTTSSILDDKDSTTTKGSKELDNIFCADGLGNEMRTKVINLLRKIIQIGTNPSNLNLNFFAGSSTKGDTVM